MTASDCSEWDVGSLIHGRFCGQHHVRPLTPDYCSSRMRGCQSWHFRQLHAVMITCRNVLYVLIWVQFVVLNLWSIRQQAKLVQHKQPKATFSHRPSCVLQTADKFLINTVRTIQTAKTQSVLVSKLKMITIIN